VPVFDPLAGTWVQGPPLPSKRGYLAAASTRGKLLAIGGYTSTSRSAEVDSLAR
jgi:hypothetical protein